MSEQTKHFWLYVLRLEQGKYYVGITSTNPDIRFKQHLSGFLAATWVKKYKPIDIIERQKLGNITVMEAKEIENKITRDYIKRFGIANVRGGNLSYGGKYIQIFKNVYLDTDWRYLKIITTLSVVIYLLFILLVYIIL